MLMCPSALYVDYGDPCGDFVLSVFVASRTTSLDRNLRHYLLSLIIVAVLSCNSQCSLRELLPGSAADQLGQPDGQCPLFPGPFEATVTLHKTSSSRFPKRFGMLLLLESQ